MPCMIGCLALFTPRLALVLVWIFSDYLGQAYQGLLWPILGFFFMPLTTLAYAWAFNSNSGSVSGIYLAAVVVAVLIDLGLMGTGASTTRRRETVRVKVSRR